MNGGLEPDVITDDQRRRIADVAVGDASLAFGILLTAASNADRESNERNTDDILLNAAGDARTQITQNHIDSLTPHQRIVFGLIREHGPFRPSKIHKHYQQTVDDPRTKCTVRTYQSKMTQYTVHEAEGTSCDR